MSKIEISKTVTTNVDVEFSVSKEEIIAHLQDEGCLDEVLEDMGYVKKDRILSDNSILSQMKLEVVTGILEKSTLDQLETILNSLK